MNLDSSLRCRFAPSPTGYLHVGGARTALFNWLLARKTGGTFIVRIEDTDVDRNVAGADEKIMQDLRWLGLQWDEGIGVGGPDGPYYQMQRLDRYQAAVKQLIEQGKAYYAFDTQEELAAMRERAEAEKRTFRYPRPAGFPSDTDANKARSESRPVVVRFAMQAEDITVHDQVMGDVTVSAGELDDFVILKGDGIPTYHLANVVDDASMRVNFVMRGQEFLSQTPRHIALQRALGYATPSYAHLPLIMDMKGRKLSKRDGDVEVFSFRSQGYLPEVLINFIALLGWSPGADREKMTLNEMVELFSIDRIGKTNPKFDREKLLAFNTDYAGTSSEDRLMTAYEDFLNVNEQSSIAIAKPDATTRRELLRVCKGFRSFPDIDTKAGFIFIDDAAVSYDPTVVQKVLIKDNGYAMLENLLPILEKVDDWSSTNLEALLKGICESHNVGMGKVAQPLRVAVSGGTISPAIYETLVLLGKNKTLNRLRNALKQKPSC